MSRVLIIEDDLATSMLMTVLLDRAGLESAVAADGARGMHELVHGDYDAVVLDLLLPEVNGFEILRHVKCTAPELLAKIVVCSAASCATLEHCDDLLLVNAFLQKPLDIDGFRDAVVAAAVPRLRLVSGAAA